MAWTLHFSTYLYAALWSKWTWPSRAACINSPHVFKSWGVASEGFQVTGAADRKRNLGRRLSLGAGPFLRGESTPWKTFQGVFRSCGRSKNPLPSASLGKGFFVSTFNVENEITSIRMGQTSLVCRDIFLDPVSQLAPLSSWHSSSATSHLCFLML